MDLEVHANQDETIGYGRLGAGFVKAWRAMGIGVHEEERTCEHIVWICPPVHVRRWGANQRRHVLTMWEATNLPPGLHENIHEFETVFVPSRQNQELFSQHHDNVVLCPLGVDPDVWYYKERKPFDRYFNFYAPGQGARKGTDVVVKAFQAAFPANVSFDPEPHLILKALTNEGYVDERFEHVNGTISAGEEMALYEHAHCSINLARGEGFGLFPIQSIAQGIPTVISDGHGHADFSHLGQAVATTLVPAGFFLYDNAGDWWEPKLDEAVDLLRDVYFNYQAHLDFAKTASGVVHEQFTWEVGARIITGVIGDSEVIADPGPWQQPALRKFLLRVNRYVDPYIAGTTYEFERNHDYRVPADVRRVLQDAGYVEPSCLEDQKGCLIYDESEGIKT